MMIQGLSDSPSVQRRHASAPLLEEREQYLKYLVSLGKSQRLIRMTASFTIQLVKILNLTKLREVSAEEIQFAAERWAVRPGFDRNSQRRASPEYFIRAAKQWLAFHKVLIRPTPPAFSKELIEYETSMLTFHGLAEATVRGYSGKIANFLRWIAKKHRTLDSVRLSDIYEFIDAGSASGHSIAFIASQCQALRSFFSYAELREWCKLKISSGIKSPRRSRYLGPPRGPVRADVRKLIRSIGTSNPNDFRARAVLLLFAVYGLRRSEVAQLRLDDFDWNNETFGVRRAKHGGIQHYPLQYEVGEAIISYLKFGRPKCHTRQLFVSLYSPYVPLGGAGLWHLVNARMKAVGVQPVQAGPHSLRHACATYLLRKGTSLQEIADFLGHRNIDAVGIYARYDQGLLDRVAAFSLAEFL